MKDKFKQFIIDENYITIPYLGGLIIKKDKLDYYFNKYQNKLDDLRYLRYNISKKISDKNDIKKFSKFFLHPAGRLCYGNCEYCFSKNYKYYPYEIKNDCFLTKNHIINFCNSIQPYIDLDIKRQLIITGGSCFMNPNVHELIDLFTSHISIQHFSIQLDLMLPQNLYDQMIISLNHIFNKYNTSRINLIITVDHGSKTRYSNSLNLNSEDINFRFLDIYQKFKHCENVYIYTRTNINKKTNIVDLIEEFKKYYDHKIVISYALVKDPIYTPDLETTQIWLKKIEDTFDISVCYQEEHAILNNERGKKINKEDNYKFQLIEIEDDIYMINPLFSECSAFKTAIGINNGRYIPCHMGYMESDKLEECLFINKNNPNYNLFFNIPQQCKTCNFLSTCMHCFPRRYMNCNDIPSLRYWEEYSWLHGCKNKENWSILK